MRSMAMRVRHAARIPALCAGLALLVACPRPTRAAAAGDEIDSARAKALVDRWGKCLIPVQVWLQKSEGEEPSSEWVRTERQERRPVEVAGLAVDPVTLWMPDLQIESRFIARIAVGPDAIPGRFHGSLLRVPGWVIETESPLKGIEPISFAPPAAIGPVESLLALTLTFETRGWTFTIAPVGRRFEVSGDSIECRVTSGALILDPDRGPAGYAFSRTLPVENAPGLWRGAEIAASPVLTAEALGKLGEIFAKKAADLSPTVRIFLRREEEEEDEFGGGRFSSLSRRFRGEAGGANDLMASGVAIGPRRVLVHLSLDREQAMRVDRVAVIVSTGERKAKFVGAFKDYGAFLVEVEGDGLPAHLDLSRDSSFTLLDPVIAVAADHATGKRRDRVEFNRIASIIRSYRNILEPTLARFPRVGALLFSPEDHGIAGAIVEIRRSEDEYGSGYVPSYMSRYASNMRYRETIDLRVMTTQELRRIVEKAPEGFDPRLRPLPVEREKDLVWFGVEFQRLDRDLARTHAVEIPTRGGEVGVLVLHVYPNSPAAEGGIEPGDILLSVKDPDDPEPFELRGGDDDISSRDIIADLSEIPDELRDEYLSQLPPPWRPQGNFINRKLTEVGEGTQVDLRYLRRGEEKLLRFKLRIGPPNFENAPREKIEAIGLTVKDLTFEVRAQYRMSDDSSGVVVAKVESGGKASVAKINPYEIIASVHGEPVRSAAEFRRKVEGFLKGAEGQARKDLELKVERLGKSRLVKIRG